MTVPEIILVGIVTVVVFMFPYAGRIGDRIGSFFESLVSGKGN